MDKVLIIDDSEFDRRMIKKAIAFKRDTVEFTELSNGLSVADMIVSESPKMAIVDIRMPGMDGFEVLETIRSIPAFCDLPVVMVSGSEQPEDRAMAAALGASGYFVKPPSAADYFSLGRDIYDQYLCCTSDKKSSGNAHDCFT